MADEEEGATRKRRRISGENEEENGQNEEEVVGPLPTDAVDDSENAPDTKKIKSKENIIVIT